MSSEGEYWAGGALAAIDRGEWCMVFVSEVLGLRPTWVAAEAGLEEGQGRLPLDEQRTPPAF
jgi:hypothetical protein